MLFRAKGHVDMSRNQHHPLDQLVETPSCGVRLRVYMKRIEEDEKLKSELKAKNETHRFSLGGPGENAEGQAVILLIGRENKRNSGGLLVVS